MPRGRKIWESKKCGAKTRSGEPCQSWANRGRERCRMHGGADGIGGQPGNRNHFQHGFYQKVIYKNLTEAEQELFDSVTAEPDLTQEMKILRFKLMRMLEPQERQMVVGTPNGAETVTLDVDEVTKTYCTEKLVDGIRKLAKDLGGGEQERFDQLLAALMAPPPVREE